MSIKTPLTAFAALATLAFAAGARAAPPASPPSDVPAPSATVSVADLDLGSDADAKIVLRRIYNAARNACTDELNPLACRKDAVDRAVAALNSPRVTALSVNPGKPATILASQVQ